MRDGKFALGPSWLHHEDNGDVVSFGFLRVGERSAGGTVRGGLGARLFYLDDGDANGFAVGLGGYAHYPLPGDHGLGDNRLG